MGILFYNRYLIYIISNSANTDYSADIIYLLYMHLQLLKIQLK